MLYAFAMCIAAGLSTGIGGLVTVLSGGISDSKMSFSQGFAAGVMLTVSVFDLAVESFEKYFLYMPARTALKAVLSLVFTGWIMGAAISGIALPAPVEENQGNTVIVSRTAAITFLVMVLHNLPEGVLTMFAATQDYSSGFRVALAVALHNLPEGIAVASPVLYLTGNRLRSFMYSLLAGFAEPLGGILAYILLRKFISPVFLNGIMPVVAGVMCQAAICELLPSALRLSNIKHTFYGTITGIITMSIGLLAF